MTKLKILVIGIIFPVLAYTQCKTIIYPSNIVVNNDEGLCGAVVSYQSPFIQDTCSVLFSENFESGFGDWTSGTFNGINNWIIQDISGTGTLFGSNMFGVPHAGNYAFGGTEHSFIQSPEFSTVGGGNFSFDYFVNNEPVVHD